MEEEREKERRSMDSARHSIDSASSRPIHEDVPLPTKLHEKGSSESLPKNIAQRKSFERTDSNDSRQIRSPLEPVVERKSEYYPPSFTVEGQDNIMSTTKQPEESSHPASKVEAHTKGILSENKMEPQSTQDLPSFPEPAQSGMPPTAPHPLSRAEPTQTVPNIPPQRTASPGGTAFLPEMNLSSFGDDFWSYSRNNKTEPAENLPPAIARSESPTKGRVSALTGKFDSNSTKSESRPQSIASSHGDDENRVPSPIKSKSVAVPSSQTTENAATAVPTTSQASSTDKNLPPLPTKTAEENPPKPAIAPISPHTVEKDLPLPNTVDEPADTEQLHSAPVLGEALRPSGPARDPSFRPHLPGQWESFTTTTGSSTPIETPQHEPETLSKAAGFSPIKEENSPVSTKSDSTWNTKSETESVKDEASPKLTENPMAALAAAGAAMGEAIKSSVGITDNRETKDEERNEQERAGPTQHISIGDIYTRPLAPDRTVSSVTGTSVSPTPPPKDDPIIAKDVTINDKPPVPSKDAPSTEAVERQPLGDPPTRPSMVEQFSYEQGVSEEESDKLRREIVASLSPVEPESDTQPALTTPFQSEAPTHPEPYVSPLNEGEFAPLDKPTAVAVDPSTLSPPSPEERFRDSSVLPAEYDTYWAGADEKEVRPVSHLTAGTEKSEQASALSSHGGETSARFTELDEEHQYAPTTDLSPLHFNSGSNSTSFLHDKEINVQPPSTISPVTSTRLSQDLPPLQSVSPTPMAHSNTEGRYNPV
jgi:hypothetical protein